MPKPVNETSPSKLFWLVVSILAVTSSLWASELPLSAQRGVCLDLPSSKEPATGTTRWWGLKQLVELGSQRFLALLTSEQARPDRWADNKKMKPQNGRAEATLEFSRTAWVVAEVNASGAILRRSLDLASPANPDTEERWMHRVGTPFLLQLEDVDTCFAALAFRDPGKLVCYDLQLNVNSEHTLGLDEVSGITFDRRPEDPRVWVFGKARTRTQGAAPSAGSKLVLNKLHVRNGKLEREELDAHAFVEDLQRVARDQQGERGPYTLSNIELAPFADPDVHPPFRTLIRAEGVKPSTQGKTNAWLFFRSEIGEDGLGEIKQLPLWIEDGSNEPVLNEESATVRVPEGTQMAQVEAFSIAPGRSGLYLMLLLPEGSAAQAAGVAPKPSSWAVLQLLFLFSNEKLLRLVDLDNEVFYNAELTKPLATSTHSVAPIRYMGRPGSPRALSFHAFGVAKDKRSPSLPCAAIFTLR